MAVVRRWRCQVIAMALGAALTGCASQTEKTPAAPRVGLEELERRAAEAYAAGSWPEAETLYREVAERAPARAEPWFRLGNVFGRTSRPDLAVAAYREAVIRDPGLAKAWHNMGVIQLRQAANSFTEMNAYVEVEDPLYEKGKVTLEGISRLLSGREPEDPGE